MMKYFLPAVGLLFICTTVSAVEKVTSNQVDAVQQRTQQVVPYSLEQTQLTFTKTVHGGIEHVVAKSADNYQQIKLIQENLLKMANDFRKGDFSVTEHIHGADMPGLKQIKKAETDDIKYEYEALPDGAQIHYTTEYPQYVQAIHEWFEAQMREHNNEGAPEHVKHHSTAAE